jgi:hypothetical protein
MAGADVAVTDATIADLVLEYAMHLGRVDTTDIVTVPIPDEGAGNEVDLLIGPASQIVLSGSTDDGDDELPRVAEIAADLRRRIERVTGRSGTSTESDEDIEDMDPMQAFVDFDEHSDPPRSGPDDA